MLPAPDFDHAPTVTDACHGWTPSSLFCVYPSSCTLSGLRQSNLHFAFALHAHSTRVSAYSAQNYFYDIIYSLSTAGSLITPERKKSTEKCVSLSHQSLSIMPPRRNVCPGAKLYEQLMIPTMQCCIVCSSDWAPARSDMGLMFVEMPPPPHTFNPITCIFHVKWIVVFQER